MRTANDDERPDLTDDPIAVTDQQEAAPLPPNERRRGRRRTVLVALGIVAVVVAIDLVAAILVPPFPKGGEAGQACAYPACYIDGNMEIPAPEVVWGPQLDPDKSVNFQVSISSTILTTWIVIALLVVTFGVAVGRPRLIPGRAQNVVEFIYEALANFAEGVGGSSARAWAPLFAAFFVFILACNWIGLVPPVGKLDFLRAPTSDLNVTIGLALTSFVFFEAQGFRQLGVRGYLGKFFPIGDFRRGIGQGILGMFVGVLEFMLEFVKPVTLSMRLFGNIFGGEVALGVITALTISLVPILMIGLEFMLNFVQAFVFSMLTLVFTMIAIEGHGEDDHETSREHGLPETQSTPLAA